MLEFSIIDKTSIPLSQQLLFQRLKNSIEINTGKT